MKNFILLTLLVTLFASCQKESPAEELNIIPPQPVHFTVEAQDTLPKSVHIELWSVKQGTQEKKDLVAVIDTTVSIHNKATFTLWQNVKPVIYCIATINVTPKVGSDFINLQIDCETGMRVRKASNCPTDHYAITNEYIALY